MALSSPFEIVQTETGLHSQRNVCIWFCFVLFLASPYLLPSDPLNLSPILVYCSPLNAFFLALAIYFSSHSLSWSHWPSLTSFLSLPSHILFLVRSHLSCSLSFCPLTFSILHQTHSFLTYSPPPPFAKLSQHAA